MKHWNMYYAFFIVWHKFVKTFILTTINYRQIFEVVYYNSSKLALELTSSFYSPVKRIYFNKVKAKKSYVQ